MLIIVVAAALVAGVIAALVFADRGGHRPGPVATVPVSTPSPSPSATLLSQAKWRVITFPAAFVGHVTKKGLKNVRLQGVKASHTIKNIYNALLLDPGEAGRVIRAHFEPGAKRAFLRVRPRIPGRISRIQTTRRSMRIGIDAKSAGNAVATVSLSFKGKRNSQRVRMKVRSTLWLERKHRSWKVVAWRTQQVPRR